MIDVVPNAGVIALGKQGENQAVRVTLPNIRAGSGSILLLHQRAADQQPYPVPVMEADGDIIWTVSSTDTAYPGRGQAELQWLGADGAVVKSVTYQTNIIRALTSPGAVPDEPLKPYTQAVARDAQAAKDAAASATEAARSAEASAAQAGLSADNAAKTLKKLEDGIASGDFRGEKGEQGEKGDPGPQGPQGEAGPAGDTTAADAAAEAAKKAAQEAQKAAEASAGSAAQTAESVGGLADDLATLKTENTALKAETARTARSLDYLWKKSRGIIYDTETVTGAGSSVTVPSGAMDYAALRMVGGMSQRDAENNVLIDAPVDEVRVAGKNVAQPIPAFSKSGVTMRVDKDGVYHFSGTATAVVGATSKKFTLPGGTYTVSVKSALPANVYVSISSIPALMVGPNTVKTGNWKGDAAYIYIYIGKDVVMDNVSIAFLCERGTNHTAYVPYQQPSTYPIPQAIRDLCPDYGQGTVDAYNYIDFTAKTYHHVGSMSQDGTWTALVTPEIIDLSAVWPDDDFGVLRVEAGGTINLHYPALDDGYELAVPSETEIMVDVAKVVQTNG